MLPSAIMIQAVLFAAWGAAVVGVLAGLTATLGRLEQSCEPDAGGSVGAQRSR